MALNTIRHNIEQYGELSSIFGKRVILIYLTSLKTIINNIKQIVNYSVFLGNKKSNLILLNMFESYNDQH